MSIDVSKITLEDRVQILMKLYDEQITLEARSSLSANEAARLQEISNDIKLASDYTKFSLPETPKIEDPITATDAAAKEQRKSELHAIPGTTSMQYIKYSQLDIVEYINNTVKLNPWGRNRKCDDDLKDLLTIVAASIKEEEEALQKASSSLRAMETPTI